jgi:hypothetical protein
MGDWSESEIRAAFAEFSEALSNALTGSDSTAWLAQLTDEVVFSDRAAGIGWDRSVTGRAAVGAWLNGLLAQPPQAVPRYRPVAWAIIDAEKGWVVCEWRNRLADLGNGQVFEWRSYARLFYAGQGRWSFIEEIYNATAARMMGAQWKAARAGLDGALPVFDRGWGNAVGDIDSDGLAAPRDEIAAAVDHFEEVCLRAFLISDHEEWVQCFTDDVTYREMAMQMDGTWYPQMNGRDGARHWINTVANAFPIDQMILFPISWYVIDPRRGWIVLEWRNQMADPGTGELFEERSYTRLKYGGNGRFSFEEDIYDPTRMREMLLRWMEARRRALGLPITESLSSLAPPAGVKLPAVKA